MAEAVARTLLDRTAEEASVIRAGPSQGFRKRVQNDRNGPLDVKPKKSFSFWKKNSMKPNIGERKLS